MGELPSVSSSSGSIGSELLYEDMSFEEIVVQFVNALGQRVQVMEDALRAGDFKRLRMAAHQLKGSGAGYGYPILSEQAAKLEQCAEARIADDCIAALDELKAICSRVEARPEPESTA